MAKSTFRTIWNVIKIALAVAGLAIAVKLVFTALNGYVNVNAEYGGSYFYNWRVKHVDRAASRTIFQESKVNEERPDKTFLRLYDECLDRNLRHVTKMSPEGVPQEYGPYRTHYPYYAYNFLDLFVIGPTKNWMIFRENEQAMEKELRYLKQRGDFISTLWKFPFSKENEFFTTGKRMSGYFNGVSVKDVRKYLNKISGNEFIPHKLVLNIIQKVIEKAPDYYVAMENNKASMTKPLENDVTALVRAVFGEEIPVTVEDINNFWYRIATVNFNFLDGHILNRIYTYCLQLFSYMDISSANSAEYSSKTKELADTIKEKAETTSTRRKGQLGRKEADLKKKLEYLRYEIIFNKISQIIGSLLGKKGIVLTKDTDTRGIFKKFGAPGVVTVGSLKGDDEYKANTNMLNDEIRKLYA